MVCRFYAQVKKCRKWSEEKISDFEFKPPESRSRLVENNEKTSV